MSNCASLNTELIARFTENGIPENIEPMKAYMKGQFEYFGIKSAQRRALSADYLKAVPRREDYFSCVQELFRSDERELNYVAMEAYFRCRKHWDQRALHQIEWLITTRSWWDTVDFLAANCLGHFLANDPHFAKKTASEWIESENMWKRRSAILFQLKYKKNTDRDLLEYLIGRTAHEKEFFIKKAIGWALRQYARVDPDWVRDLIERITLQPLSVREATKHL